MKRYFGAAAVLVAVFWLEAAEEPRVNREELAVIEKSFDQRIESYDIKDPFYLLGTTRGVYLEDYGVVLTAELNLVAAAVMTPFRPVFTKEQIEELRQKKILRLAALKEIMRDMLVTSAASLSKVRPQEQIVIGVSLFCYSWEDTRDLPAQVLMQARRESLLDFKAGRIDNAALDSSIRVQEF